MVISLFVEAVLGVAPSSLTVLKADEEIILRNKGWEGGSLSRESHPQIFLQGFDLSEDDLKTIVAEANSANVKWNEKEFNRSKPYIRLQVKAFMARQLFQKKQRDGLNNEFYQVMAPLDNVYQKALRSFDQAEQLARGNYSLKK